MLGCLEFWGDRGRVNDRFFVCILHAIIGNISFLSFLSVLRINNLRVCNTCRGSTPAASTKTSAVSLQSLFLVPILGTSDSSSKAKTTAPWSE